MRVEFEFICITRVHALAVLATGRSMPPGWYWRLKDDKHKSPLDGYHGPMPSEQACHDFVKKLVDEIVKEKKGC